MEVKGTHMKEGGLCSHSKEPVWGEAAEDKELKPRGEEQ